jgi:hypothetical protein
MVEPIFNSDLSMSAASSERADSHEHWQAWQHEVLTVIRTDFRNLLDAVEFDDIDWEAWRPLYEQGCSPREAVRNAFGRVA